MQNVLADPDRLPRYLLKYVVSRLAEGGRGPLYQPPLHRIGEHAIRQAADAWGVQQVQDARSSGPSDDYQACRSGVRRLGVRGPSYGVLRTSSAPSHARPEKAGDPARRRLAAEAVAWLSGDEIDPDAARLLGLKADRPEPVMLRDDQEVPSKSSSP